MIAEVNNYTKAIIIHKFFDILARNLIYIIIEWTRSQ